MAHRPIFAGALLTLGAALAACSGGEPASEEARTQEAAAPAADALEAEPTAAPSATPAATETPAAAETPVAEPTKAAIAAPAPAKAAAAPAAAEVVKVAAAAPPASFARCAVCHTAEKGGEDRLGPNLYGVYGKPAAQGSFAFSEAFKAAGLVLDEPTLHRWLENPRALVPGNRMSFPGIKDPAKRQEIIDYLKRQS